MGWIRKKFGESSTKSQELRSALNHEVPGASKRRPASNPLFNLAHALSLLLQASLPSNQHLRSSWFLPTLLDSAHQLPINPPNPSGFHAQHCQEFRSRRSAEFSMWQTPRAVTPPTSAGQAGVKKRVRAIFAAAMAAWLSSSKLSPRHTVLRATISAMWHMGCCAKLVCIPSHPLWMRLPFVASLFFTDW